MTDYRCDYLVIIHRLFIDKMPKKGGVDIIIDYLIDNGNTISLVEHPLESNGRSIFTIRDSKNGVDTVAKRIPRLLEILVTVIFILRNFRFIPYCIAVDPLNALSAIILKKIKKVGMVYFHCIDYSPQRFKNRILNMVYHGIYQFALNRADVCGVVSRRMLQDFHADLRDKMYFIPNSPVFKERSIDLGTRNKHCAVIMSGRIDEKTNYENIINVLVRLKVYYPNIEFKIIAKTEDNIYERSLKEYIKDVGFDGQVSFLGFFPNPSDLEGILANCGVGLTSYSFDKAGYHTEYGDSLKIREYASYGLPIVADNICDTAFEAQENKCGFVVNNEAELENALRILWEDDNTYRDYANNALQWARRIDKRQILDGLISRIESFRQDR